MVCIRSISASTALLATSCITAFTVLPQLQSRPTHGNIQAGRPTATPLFMSSAARLAEFELPDEEPKKQSTLDGSRMKDETLSDARRMRFQLEEQARDRFVTGDALRELRQQVLEMREQLEEARSTSGMGHRVQELERAIVQAQQTDAEFVYSVAHDRLSVAKEAGLTEEANLWETEAALARSALPQFNLEGLWVGKYGEHGYEMVNVTYVGDTLVAHKVTGDKNVPKGEVTFTADLSPSSEQQLDPIELGEGAAKKWGSKYLQRHAGSGQVAAEGYTNSQWMEGHLIMVGEYFSFAWIPIGHQVFFGRPSAELTLKLLRESKSKSVEDKVRDYLTKCLEETESLEEEMEVHEGPFFSHHQHDYYTQTGCFE